MNKKTIVLAGGTGFTGQYLEAKFKTEACRVIIISRQAGHIHWNDRPAILQALEGSDMLINLAGKSVDCRYTENNKALIFSSRTGTTQLLGEIMQECRQPPPLWINSSTATIYRHAEDRPMTEKDGEIGKGFSVEVAKAWEKTFFDFNLPATRQVALRMAIVLGKDGGAMKPLATMSRLGLGGKQGNGRQMFSWLHIEDLYRIIKFVESHQELSGPINTSAPNPVDNSSLMKAIRATLHIPTGIPAPAWLLKIGAAIIGTETELLLKSRWVIPGKLMEAGFDFRFPDIHSALHDILKT